MLSPAHFNWRKGIAITACPIAGLLAFRVLLFSLSKLQNVPSAVHKGLNATLDNGPWLNLRCDMVVRLYVDYVLVQHVLANLFTRSYHAYERAFHVANTKWIAP